MIIFGFSREVSDDPKQWADSAENPAEAQPQTLRRCSAVRPVRACLEPWRLKSVGLEKRRRGRAPLAESSRADGWD